MVQFIQLSGGLDGGSEPPAFQRAERERKAKECAEENVNDSSVEELACDTQNNSNNLNVPSIFPFRSLFLYSANFLVHLLRLQYFHFLSSRNFKLDIFCWRIIERTWL